jgi:acetyl esterase/lipase
MDRSLRFSRLALASFFCLVAFATGCTKFEVLNATVPSWGYVRTKNLAYGNLPRQKLDVYRPKNVAVDAKPGARVVIFFYGGDWQAGQKGDYRFVGQALASKGFIAVLPDYRLYPEAAFPRFVEDGALVVRWVRDNITDFGGDPGRIYLMGHSAGAHIAALLTLDEHYLKAVGLDGGAVSATAALSGPYDFIPGDSDRAVFGMKVGDSASQEIEPLHFADGHGAPMLLIHGLRDDIVHPDNAVKLAAAIEGAGGQVRCVIHPNLGHAGVALSLAWSFRWLAPVLHDSVVFFEQH